MQKEGSSPATKTTGGSRLWSSAERRDRPGRRDRAKEQRAQVPGRVPAAWLQRPQAANCPAAWLSRPRPEGSPGTVGTGQQAGQRTAWRSQQDGCADEGAGGWWRQGSCPGRTASGPRPAVGQVCGHLAENEPNALGPGGVERVQMWAALGHCVCADGTGAGCGGRCCSGHQGWRPHHKHAWRVTTQASGGLSGTGLPGPGKTVVRPQPGTMGEAEQEGPRGREEGGDPRCRGDHAGWQLGHAGAWAPHPGAAWQVAVCGQREQTSCGSEGSRCGGHWTPAGGLESPTAQPALRRAEPSRT